MGLEADYPAVRINDPASTVAVWNGAHTVIGRLGPDDYYHSAAVNVTCTLKRANGRWYRLLNPNGWDIPASAAYVSTSLTHLMDDSQVTHPLYECASSDDQPGRRWPFELVAAAFLGLALVALLLRGRKQLVGRPRPPRPGPGEAADLDRSGVQRGDPD